MLGFTESLIVIIVLALAVYFLGRKSPEIARQTGKSISEFKAGLKEIPEAIKEAKEEIKK